MRFASKTYGSSSDQLRWVLSILLVNIFSNVRLVFSVTALDSGWKAVVRVLSNWSSLVRLMNSFVLKLRPRSE